MSEFYAETFIVDEVRVEPGEEIWVKSFSILDEDIWLFKKEDYYVVKFSEHISSRAPEIGDYLLLRGLNEELGLFVYNLWFRVTSVLFDKNENPYKYIIRREAGDTVNSHVAEGAVFFNFGRGSDSEPIKLDALL